jgi:hypothetical protein
VAPGKTYPRLIIHELGHSFAARVRDINKEFDPVDMLLKYGIYDNQGTFITGQTNHKYNRDNGLDAPQNGYWSDNYKDEWQWHPRRMAGGNTPSEDFADMFLNWVCRSFVPNDAGATRDNWMDIHIPFWLDVITDPSHQQSE